VSEEVVEDLRQRLKHNPQTSLTRLSQRSEVPLGVTKRIHMHPYTRKISRIQQLLLIDPQSHL
jgi:hypothetical protein